MKLNCTTGTQVGEESVGAGRADVGLHGTARETLL